MSQTTDYAVVEGGQEWAERCREFCRRAYLAAYVRPERGITEDLFSEAVFASPRIMKYYYDLCATDDNHKLWLAVNAEQELLGMVVAQRATGHCEMRAFYVKPELKGHGIGHDLYQKVLEFAGDQAIHVDVVEYMQETIDMYRHWGFYIDEAKGKFIYPLVEWPEAARQAYRAIYMTKSAA
jgi:ribosomal protein S18 acetylase RimI-like enzyme